MSIQVEPIIGVAIETTTHCNRRCSYCPNSVFERGLKENTQLIDPALFRKIIDDLAEMGFKGHLHPHLYGKPLTDPRLVSFMQYAHEKLPKAALRIFTNGDLLTPTLLDELKAAGVRDYVITLQSTDEQSLTRSIDKIEQLKRHAKAQNKDIKLVYRTRIAEAPLYNRGGLVDVEKLAPPYCLDNEGPTIINYRGDVLICCNDYLGQVVFGNVCHESLKDIWSKPEFVRIRRQVERKIYTLDICKKCAGVTS
ncbi:MAG: radical SAM/SPASM domain-containing protein [Halobacteriota archaeon]